MNLTKTISSIRLLPIRVGALYPPLKPNVDFYLEESCTVGATPYSRAANPPTAGDLDRLTAGGIHYLYVMPHDAADLRHQMHDLVQSGADWSPHSRIEAAREMVKDSMAQAWRSKQCDGLVKHAAQLGNTIVESCWESDRFAEILASIVAHDGDTFSHITNVCIYSVMLARSMGINDQTSLQEIGQAALLHDIGKRSISTDILRKPGKLTPAERERMNDHPRLGFIELCKREDLNEGQLRMVYEHHERFDGRGYPVGLRGEEIHWMARLCSVVDVFDALTGQRCYRRPASREEALEHLQEKAGTVFDREFAECWARQAETMVMG